MDNSYIFELQHDKKNEHIKKYQLNFAEHYNYFLTLDKKKI